MLGYTCFKGWGLESVAVVGGRVWLAPGWLGGCGCGANFRAACNIHANGWFCGDGKPLKQTFSFGRHADRDHAARTKLMCNSKLNKLKAFLIHIVGWAMLQMGGRTCQHP